VRSVASLEVAARVAGTSGARVAGGLQAGLAKTPPGRRIQAGSQRPRFGSPRRRSLFPLLLRPAFAPQHAEIVFGGVESPCYLRSQLSADGVLAIFPRGPN
jgi:hypothetical protein